MGKGKGSMSLEQECCPICGKVVYDAESYPAGYFNVFSSQILSVHK